MAIKDLTNVVVNNIQILHPNGKTKANKRKWLCVCYCGKEFTAIGSQIVLGKTKSCGCRAKPHGDKGSIFYGRWSGMKNRCFNPNDIGFKHYGGRGITVCERWLKYLNFKADMFKSFKPDLTLERLNVNGNYEPKNCEWRTVTAQNRNKRTNHLIATPWGEITIAEAAEKAGLRDTCLHYRIKNCPPEKWFLPLHFRK